MKIVTLCGCGLGTCFLLKFAVEKVLNQLGMPAEVIPCDLSNASLERADIFVFPQGLQVDKDLTENAYRIEIRNVIDEQEIEEKLKIYIKGS